jgi:hypothetical protein
VTSVPKRAIRVFYQPPDRSEVAPPVLMLLPTWPHPDTCDPLHPEAVARHDWKEIGGHWVLRAPVEQADVIVFPYDWRWIDRAGMRALFHAHQRLALEHGKPLWVFYWDDSEAPLDEAGVIWIRTSLAGATCRPGIDCAMPPWDEDLLRRYCGGALQLAEKRAKPTVSFCGRALHEKELTRRMLKTAARSVWRGLMGAVTPDPRRRDGQMIRALAMRNLSRDPRIAARFSVHDTFYGGAVDVSGSTARWLPERLAEVKSRYVESIRLSDYVLCARGNGNYSHRLYETLCLGKIPVFVNTDCVLPFHDRIAWRESCVWVEYEDLDHIAERVVAFHQALGPEDFRERQRRSRELWEDWLSPAGFFSHLLEGVVGAGRHRAPARHH